MIRRSAGADLALALGLAAGVAADALIGDPARGHPVAAFGALAGCAERILWRPSHGAGAAHTLLCVGPVAVGGWALQRLTAGSPPARLLLTAATTWATVARRGLAREALALEHTLETDGPDGARARLQNLCGRDPAGLDAAALRRATVESVAENTSDAVVAPLVWGAVAGIPGLVGYRAVNTLDAMVGHRNDRYARFGTPAARLDDLANLLPARLTAALATALAPTVGGRPAEAWRVWRRDAGDHPSPNAGRPEAAFAGALGVRLGGPVRYGDRSEARPWLGGGRTPGPWDVRAAVRLSRAVGLTATLAAVVVRARPFRHAARGTARR